jgi:hypothetical protein
MATRRWKNLQIKQQMEIEGRSEMPRSKWRKVDQKGLRRMRVEGNGRQGSWGRSCYTSLDEAVTLPEHVSRFGSGIEVDDGGDGQ